MATARVKGAAKLEIPHLEDHVSKIECVGVQTQKKLEDIRAAAAAANVPDLHLPMNSVTKGRSGEGCDFLEASDGFLFPSAMVDGKSVDVGPGEPGCLEPRMNWLLGARLPAVEQCGVMSMDLLCCSCPQAAWP